MFFVCICGKRFNLINRKKKGKKYSIFIEQDNLKNCKFCNGIYSIYDLINKLKRYGKIKKVNEVSEKIKN